MSRTAFDIALAIVVAVGWFVVCYGFAMRWW